MTICAQPELESDIFLGTRCGRATGDAASADVLQAAAERMLTRLEAAEEASAQWWARITAVPAPRPKDAAPRFAVQTRLVFGGNRMPAAHEGRKPAAARRRAGGRWPSLLRTASLGLHALVG